MIAHPRPLPAWLSRSAARSIQTAAANASRPAPALARTVKPIPTTLTKPASFSTTSTSKQAAVSDSTPSASAPAPKRQTAKTVGRTTNRIQRGVPRLPLQKARFLLNCDWYEPSDPKAAELPKLIEVRRRKFPDWVLADYEVARSFRSARSRRWTPTVEEIKHLTADENVSSTDSWIQSQIDEHQSTLTGHAKYTFAGLEFDQQADVVLRSLWNKMDNTLRDQAMVRVRYECIRRLGWRQGYSSGYPRHLKDGENDLPEGLGLKPEDHVKALEALREREDERAWKAWQSYSPARRLQEEKSAWALRDRSVIYKDDSDSSKILGIVGARWLARPERAGQLTFLPNTIVRLVKNYTPEGQPYDPWKATFRVPLSMHKHALRSYLLAIYGLKTTWARSSIYRTPITREIRTGKKVTGRGRTWKKVEVGLLEPFIFPEASPEFKRDELMQSELDYERARVYMKITKANRWRSKKSIEEYEQEIRNAEANTYSGNASSEVFPDEKRQNKPRFFVRTKGLPSAKHGKILRLLSQQRQERERAVEELVNKYKAEDRKAASSTETPQ